MMNSSYRMTEVGLLPDDWDAKRFSESFTLVRNNTYARECLTDHPGSVANVHYGDVLIKYGAVLDFAKNAVPYLKSDVKPNKDMLRDGDLVFADTAEDEAVGKAVEVQGLKSRMAVAGLHTVASRPHDGLFAPRYLGYYINSAAYHNQLLPLITGTKVSSVSRACFLSTYVAIPPKSEQRRIAGALSDVDELITALGKLIEKKRNIKTGAMQELLGMRNEECGMRNVPRRRLAGFSGEWIEKRLGEIGDFIAGNGFPLSKQGDKSGDYPFFKVSDFNNIGNEDVLCVANNYISESTFNELHCSLIPSGSIVFAKIGAAIALERKRRVCYDSCIDNNMMAFCVNRQNDERFITECLRRVVFADLAESTALPALNVSKLREYKIVIPKSIAEQKAIVAVLSDIDAEIAALEADRAKYESIKQGMMQELLTGKTRIGGFAALRKAQDATAGIGSDL